MLPGTMADNRRLQEQLRRSLDDLAEARAQYLQTADQTYAAEHEAALARVHRLRGALGLADLSGAIRPDPDDFI